MSNSPELDITVPPGALVTVSWDDVTQTRKVTWTTAPVSQDVIWNDEMTPALLWHSNFDQFGIPEPELSFFSNWQSKYTPSAVNEALQIAARKVDIIQHENKSIGLACYATGCLKQMAPTATTKPKSVNQSRELREMRARMAVLEEQLEKLKEPKSSPPPRIEGRLFRRPDVGVGEGHS